MHTLNMLQGKSRSIRGGQGECQQLGVQFYSLLVLSNVVTASQTSLPSSHCLWHVAASGVSGGGRLTAIGSPNVFNTAGHFSSPMLCKLMQAVIIVVAVLSVWMDIFMFISCHSSHGLKASTATPRVAAVWGSDVPNPNITPILWERPSIQNPVIHICWNVVVSLVSICRWFIHVEVFQNEISHMSFHFTILRPHSAACIDLDSVASLIRS